MSCFSAVCAVCGESFYFTSYVVRQAIVGMTCGDPRCGGRLPENFSDREDIAYVWLEDQGINIWSIDLDEKFIIDLTTNHQFPSLIEFAQLHGWTG